VPASLPVKQKRGEFCKGKRSEVYWSETETLAK